MKRGARSTYPRNVLFRMLNLAVQLAPARRKHYHNSILFQKSMADIPKVSAPYEARWAGAAEFAFIMAHPKGRLLWTDYPRRVERGDRCLCLMKSDEVASYIWITFQEGSEPCGVDPKMENAFMTLAPEQAFTYDLYVREPHRDHGVATVLKQLCFQSLKAMDIEQVFSVVNVHNAPALNLHVRTGEEPQRLMYGYQIGNWKKTFLGPLPDQRLKDWWNEYKLTYLR